MSPRLETFSGTINIVKHLEIGRNKQDMPKIKAKMTPVQTYFAICKGYCAINILILPKQFDNGGWLVGILSINIASLFVYLCANKIVQCAIKIDNCNFSEIANTALGHRGKMVADIFLAIC